MAKKMTKKAASKKTVVKKVSKKPKKVVATPKKTKAAPKKKLHLKKHSQKRWPKKRQQRK